MTRLRTLTLAACAALATLAGCASRPVNPPIAHADPNAGYRLETRVVQAGTRENLIILAFSGGGTRAAAFSYGVLEFLRRTEVVTAQGETMRLLDAVDVITGVSGGSFTALAYGLYGDKLFVDYEQRSARPAAARGSAKASRLLPRRLREPRVARAGHAQAQVIQLLHVDRIEDLVAGHVHAARDGDPAEAAAFALRVGVDAVQVAQHGAAT